MPSPHNQGLAVSALQQHGSVAVRVEPHILACRGIALLHHHRRGLTAADDGRRCNLRPNEQRLLRASSASVQRQRAGDRPVRVLGVQAGDERHAQAVLHHHVLVDVQVAGVDVPVLERDVVRGDKIAMHDEVSEHIRLHLLDPGAADLHI